jgi:lambda family phage portal protein
MWRLLSRILPQTRRFDVVAGRRQAIPFQTFGSTNPETLAAAGTIRSRARYAAHNQPFIANGVNAWVTSLIGAGITPTPQHPDAAARNLLGGLFTTWAASADAHGRTDLYGLQADVARAVVVDGECFAHLRITPEGLRVQIIPAEMVDESYTLELEGGRRIIAGIEFDAFDRRAAYWIRQARPTDLYGSYLPPVRVPASDVLHIFKPLGPGQVRGVSWLAPVLMTAAELDQLMDALLIGAKVAAMHAGFLIDQNGTAGTPYDGAQVGSVLESGLEPGTLKVVPSGMDIKFNSPAQASESVAFARLTLEAIAAGLGVPEHLLTGNLNGANYSSLRAGLVAFRQRVEQIQFHTLIPQFCKPVYERMITTAVLSGDLDAPDFEARPGDWLACEWIPPAQPWVDPLKDVQAAEHMIAAGLMSRRQAVAMQGYSVERLDSEIAADRAREQSIGLSFSQKESADAGQNSPD